MPFNRRRQHSITENVLVTLQIILTGSWTPETIPEVYAASSMLILPPEAFQLSPIYQDWRTRFYIGVRVTKLGIEFGYQQLPGPIRNVQSTSEAGLE